MKITEKNIFLPADVDDFEDFLSSNSFDKLLHYVDQIKKIGSDVRKASKEYKIKNFK